MTIRPTKNGWQVDIQPGGRSGRRLRKSFKTKREALEWEIWANAQAQEAPNWAPPKKDRRTLRELAGLWFNLHGMNLKRGQKTHAALLVIAEGMGNPQAWQITSARFAEYRKRRLDGSFIPSTETRKTQTGGISAAAANRDLAYLRAMFNELVRLGEWNGENPVSTIRQVKQDDRELAYLDQAQITSLLGVLAKDPIPDTLLQVKTCLATGARWGEAEKMRSDQVKEGRILLTSTKNGKIRAIPISGELEQELLSHGSSRHPHEPLFRASKKKFEQAVELAGIQLPEGQSAHVLRHTFASHFIIRGGNILTLQRILDHSSLTTTMRYAHLAPDHLADAVTFNPLAPLARR